MLKDKKGKLFNVTRIGQNGNNSPDSALKDSEIRYRRLFEAAKDGIFNSEC